MYSIKNYVLLFVSILSVTLQSYSQEIADQLNRAKSLPYGPAQLNIILDILRPSSGASASQRQEAADFPIFKDRSKN